MAIVVPRWEWRTFGPGVERARPAFAPLTVTGVQETDERYFVGSLDASAKVRAGLIDVKALLETDEFGLQQWRPVLKAAFPLAGDDIRALADALGIPGALPDAGPMTEEALVAELTGERGGMRCVDVHKRRMRYVVGGCTSEVTELVVDGRHASTLAIEGEDASAVAAAVTSVGLGDYRNMSYPAGLRWLLDGERERYAVIDVGTNSVKTYTAERGGDGGWQRIVDRAEITRLGEGMSEAREIAPAPLARTADAIAGIVDEADRNGVLALVGVGTAGLRMARNGEAVVDEISARSRVRLRVIDGEEEARLAYRAAVAGNRVAGGRLAVMDTGGGSTQLSFGTSSGVTERFSVDVGAIRIAERFGLDGIVSREVVDEALATIAGELERLDAHRGVDALIGMGGAITNMTGIHHQLERYDPDVVQGSVLERAEVDRQIELFRSTSVEDRRRIVGLQSKRAEVILAGACIVRTVMDKLGVDELTVSDRALRHGLLEEQFGAPAGPRRDNGNGNAQPA